MQLPANAEQAFTMLYVGILYRIAPYISGFLTTILFMLLNKFGFRIEYIYGSNTNSINKHVLLSQYYSQDELYFEQLGQLVYGF